MDRDKHYKKICDIYNRPEPEIILPSTTVNSTDPTVWGPSFWFSLHNGALSYPENASSIVSTRMKGFIMGLPYILPCTDCSEHARVFIEMHYNELDKITSCRDNLFCFFVDFHNQVNKRYGKPVLTCSEAKKLYAR